MDDRVKEASEQRDKMLRLRASDGWQHLCTVLEETKDQLMSTVILNACPGIDAVLVQEFSKGKLAGFEAFVKLPDAIIDASNAIIDSMKPAEEEDLSDAA